MTSYQTLALRTAASLGSPCNDFVHAALGIVTELHELDTATSEQNALEELGDICWFIALASHALDMPMPDPVPNSCDPSSPACAVADAAKRWLAYGKAPDADDVPMALLLGYVEQVAHEFGYSLAQVQDMNIKKLRARFPDKFSQVDALERDVDAEYREMMK